jgi:hypothetical protein
MIQADLEGLSEDDIYEARRTLGQIESLKQLGKVITISRGVIEESASEMASLDRLQRPPSPKLLWAITSNTNSFGIVDSFRQTNEQEADITPVIRQFEPVDPLVSEEKYIFLSHALFSKPAQSVEPGTLYAYGLFGLELLKIGEGGYQIGLVHAAEIPQRLANHPLEIGHRALRNCGMVSGLSIEPHYMPRPNMVIR